MTTEHTPGAWHVRYANPNSTHLCIYGPGHTKIAQMRTGLKERLMADANLLSAAPNLLAIAEWVDASPCINMPDSKREELRAAIAKARGK